MSKRFILTIFTLVVVLLGTAIAIFLAKGYRVSPQTGTVAGTGIMSVISIPDQASVYLDDHLSTATDANINSLPPKVYKVRIVKEGFIPWEKDIEVKEGLVSQVKATLFPSIPSIYPLTFNGVENVLVSPDRQRAAYIVPGKDRKSGIWVWEMTDRPIGFARGREPHQVAAVGNSGYDYTKAIIRWSPNSSQLLVNLPDRSLLLDSDRLNDPPRDITAILAPTIASWNKDEETGLAEQLQSITDRKIRAVASESAYFRWSPDETKILVRDSAAKATPSPKPNNQEQNPEGDELVLSSYKIFDLENKKEYQLPKAYSYEWLADSEHLVMVNPQENQENQFVVSVIEYDGFNKSDIYAGNFNPKSVFVWPDGSRLVIVTSLSTPTASKPNLFGINLK